MQRLESLGSGALAYLKVLDETFIVDSKTV